MNASDFSDSPRAGGYDAVSSDLDDRAWLEERVREKCFAYLHKEVPYRMGPRS